MNKLRKLGLRISFATVILGVVFWFTGLLSNANYADYQALAIYLLVSAVFFASPYMIITHEKESIKPKLETYADLGVSGFYTGALIFVLYNAIPYFNSGETVSTLQLIGQVFLVISFLWTLCIHIWSTLKNLANTIKPSEF